MTPDEKIQRMAMGSGALAEVVKMYYDALIRVGFKSMEAVTLTAAYQTSIIGNAFKQVKEEDES